MNKKLEKMRNESVSAEFEVLFWNFLELQAAKKKSVAGPRSET
jgi:hypothetical protein